MSLIGDAMYLFWLLISLRFAIILNKIGTINRGNEKKSSLG